MACWAVRCTLRGAAQAKNRIIARSHNIPGALIRVPLLWCLEQPSKRPRAITVANQGTSKESASNFKTTSQLGGSPRAEVRVVGVPEVARVKVRVLLVQMAVVQVGTEAVKLVEGAMEDTSSSTTSVNQLM